MRCAHEHRQFCENRDFCCACVCACICEDCGLCVCVSRFLIRSAGVQIVALEFSPYYFTYPAAFSVSPWMHVCTIHIFVCVSAYVCVYVCVCVFLSVCNRLCMDYNVWSCERVPPSLEYLQHSRKPVTSWHSNLKRLLSCVNILACGHSGVGMNARQIPQDGNDP